MKAFWIAAVISIVAATASAQEDPGRTLFTNVNVWDGTSDTLVAADVLVEGNLIAAVSTEAMDPEGAAVIAGEGRMLMPGIIDSHIHLVVGNISAADILNELPGYITIRSALAAEQLLDQGVTTVRELGGEAFTIKRAIDEGLIPGPRIFPSGAFITQTSGHFDFRPTNAANPSLTGDIPEFSRNHVYMVDSPDAVRAAARENLRRGAAQLKLAIGGGVSSPTDPIDTTQFTVEEIAAAVEAAENWGTYVTVHGYTDRAIN